MSQARETEETPECLVELCRVSKSFDNNNGEKIRALQEISFRVHRGEVVTLTGPSGSGKSTCLRTINALETIDSGHISLVGKRIDKDQRRPHHLRRKTAMIFQHFELFPHLTVLENVALAQHVTRGRKKAEARVRSLEFLDEVGMAEFAQQYPAQLSGGQKQRVAIARALAVEPEVLLCDEPTSALDPERVSEITSVLSRIAASGMTMIMVTHEMEFARNVSTRCVFMEGGRLLVDKPTPEFFSPLAGTHDQRLRRFLGEL